ncbi:hypothetical protein [Lysinibacillus irui]|uniref:hypothetical protein n=1 Tax=Lysinibacillus irui TaxID=2998077 RepID=UPI002AD5AD9E|nr:hypothetical protein [Lysinibacillus irui]MEA0565006.1 hypothetical protein [Lysinibacillus irui]
MKGEVKIMQTIEYRTMYENEVNKQYHELKEIYSEIQKKLKELSEKNPELYNELEDSLIKDEVNFIFNGEDFKKFNLKKEEFIEEALLDYHTLKTQSLSEIFAVRKRMLNKRNEKLNDTNYRTALSLTSEFFNDVYIDVLKNKLIFSTKNKDQNKQNLFGIEFKKEPVSKPKYLFNSEFLKME